MDHNPPVSPKEPFIHLVEGKPGRTRLLACSDIILEATKNLLKEDCDASDIFSYGADGGDEEFRQNLAQFLSVEYGDTVERDTLMLTAGATHGLHVCLTLLISGNSPVFVIDPTYFFGRGIIEHDLPNPIVAVPTDDQGPIMDKLESLLKDHVEIFENGKRDTIAGKYRPYNAAVYLCPAFNNPTGHSYSSELCQQLIHLSRRYNIVLVADDVYNILYYNGSLPQKRLFAYDTLSDPDYGKGHVISNGSFSKLLAPGLRLGWMEGPKNIISDMVKSNMSKSGGSFNHYVGKLVSEVIRSGKLKEHVAWLRKDYKMAMDSLCRILDEKLPRDVEYYKPTGGFFVWVPLRSDIDTEELCEFTQREFQLDFLPGIFTSPSKNYKNFVRLSICFHDIDTLCKGAERFCQAYKVFLSQKSNE